MCVGERGGVGECKWVAKSIDSNVVLSFSQQYQTKFRCELYRDGRRKKREGKQARRGGKGNALHTY